MLSLPTIQIFYHHFASCNVYKKEFCDASQKLILTFSFSLSETLKISVPLRNFYTGEMFVFVRMQSRNHVDTLPITRFKR